MKDFASSISAQSKVASMKRCLCMVLAAAAVFVATACGTDCADSLPPGFVHVAEAVPDAILEVRYYSTYNFIGDQEQADRAGGSDGVVPYSSSHLDGAASEVIVQSGHSVHRSPGAMQELLRILLLHLREDQPGSEEK